MTPKDLANLMFYGGITGFFVTPAMEKGIQRMDRLVGSQDIRLNKMSVGNMNKVSSEKNASFKAFREKRADLGHILQIAGQHAMPLTGSLIGGMAVSNLLSGTLGGLGRMASPAVKDPAEVFGYGLYKQQYPGLRGMLAYTKAPETVLSGALERFGSGLGDAAALGVQQAAHSIIDKNKEVMLNSPRRKLILESLKMEDEVIRKMDNKIALEAYHSMIKVAPTLSLDKNAVKSFLRMVALAPEGGVDWNTLKGLADAESSITKAQQHI